MASSSSKCLGQPLKWHFYSREWGMLRRNFLVLYNSLGHSPRCFPIRLWFCIWKLKKENIRNIFKGDEELQCVLFRSYYLAGRSEYFHGRAGLIKWKHTENGFWIWIPHFLTPMFSHWVFNFLISRSADILICLGFEEKLWILSQNREMLLSRTIRNLVCDNQYFHGLPWGRKVCLEGGKFVLLWGKYIQFLNLYSNCNLYTNIYCNDNLRIAKKGHFLRWGPEVRWKQ